MRLTQIKLSGFKSFAEPTTFQLPGRRVGVVGPNGCGKSNVIDAVRWVLGESKASELRGESMQDVIFNGSGQRKPAGRASVELVFDNAAARAGGQWNAFAEIAVKRVLTRDGTSSYSINGQPVRRRDVHDVFLGTGLGPRAYAIIGQGTISRIIESRPEELRLFLEEAAGVSKYKERRRETESRLRDTRENLVRVEDILRELNANLDKLAAQAEVAGRWRSLQDDGMLKLHQLWWLKSRDAAAEEARVRTAVADAATALDAQLADLRATEAALEALRQSHYAAGDALHGAQGHLADAALAVSRLEERIRYVVEGRARAAVRLAELHAQHAGWAARQGAADDELQALAGRIDAAVGDADVVAAQADEAAQALPALQDAARAAQADANRQRGDVAQVQQQIQVLAADSRNIGEQQRALGARRDRLAAERRGLQPPDAARIDALRADDAAAAARRDETDAQLHALSDRLPLLDAERREAQQTVNAESARGAGIGARLSALRALQARLQTGGKLQPWLERHGLERMAPLWSQLQVEPGWEAALESALRERLNALAVSRLDGVAAFASDAPPARLAFYALPEVPVAATETGGLPLLARRLRLGDAGLKSLLDGWLTGIRTADSVEAALAARQQLAPGELLMTREGHAIGRDSVAWYAPDAEQAGMLARAQEIENLDREQRAQALLADAAKSASVRLEAAYTDVSALLAQARRNAAEAQAQAHALQVELLQLTQQMSVTEQRGAQIDAELAEIDAQLEALDERRGIGEARFDGLDAALADAQQRHAELDDAVIAAERALADAREQQRMLALRAQQAQFEARALLARRAELQRDIDTAAMQLANAVGAREQAQAELDGYDDAAAQSGLQDALAVRQAREADLAAVRSRYDDLTAQMRRTDERRMAAEQGLEPLRDATSRLQLELQAARLGGAQYVEQLTAAAVDLVALERSVSDGGVKLWGLQTEIDRINREIAELGAVNLAALDELTQGRERKTFLDAQLADLSEAIHTLEGAIHTIDLETRQLLGSTFEQVNEGFGRMFPVLFGGGMARLVMTGDEILDAGVQVMAQPPGKKNSTIHLLSGGEKALTAIALVFAIFQLNPAPFCLLDEVDAPLDDANTERYCKLVTQMSAGTQFLYISHNRIAMEMAEQLIGVTMQEQGVSRIVAVDVESAVGLAEAA